MLEINPNAISYNDNILNQTYAVDYTNRYSHTIWKDVWIYLSWSTKTPVQEWNSWTTVTVNTANISVVKSNVSGGTWGGGWVLSIWDIVAQSGSEIARYAWVYTWWHGKTLWLAGTESTSLKWKTTNDNTTNASSITDGRLNTGTFNVNHPASNYCQNLVRAWYSDWYLPASSYIDATKTNCSSQAWEMQFLYCQDRWTGISLLWFWNNGYWSSTQYLAGMALALDVTSGGLKRYYDNPITTYVRCVRVAD